MKTRLSKTSETAEFGNWYARPGDGPQGYKKTVENSVPLDETTCAYIIHEIVKMVQSYYLNPSMAKLITSRLTDNMSRGVYSNINDVKTFAQAMTNDLQQFSRDKHFRLLFGVHPAQPSNVDQLHRLQDLNYGFGDIIDLPGNITYVCINGFVPIHWVGVRSKLAEIMSSLASADGLLLDLRENKVGDPATVALLASYLLEAKPSVWLRFDDHRARQQVEVQTTHVLEGPRFGITKPIVVMTSANTISGGEDLSYVLQKIGRAKVVGECTAGAANIPRPCVLNDLLTLFVPNKSPIHPTTGLNWEGSGVEPDVYVRREDAFENACNQLKATMGLVS